MGESNSKPLMNEDFLSQMKHRYASIGEHRDTRLGTVNLFEDPLSEEGVYLAEKNVVAHSKEDVDDFLCADLSKVLSLRSKYLLKVHAYKVHNEDSMCGSISSLSTYHEYYSNTLADEIERRNQVNLFYLESELWAILYSIISANDSLAKADCKSLTDIRPMTIYFTPNGEVKLHPFGIYLGDLSAYSKVLSGQEECLLAPEQLSKLRKSMIKDSINIEKCDTFSTGITMLMCASLQTQNSLYDYDNYTIKEEFVGQLFEYSKSQYSKFFNNIIKIMLSSDANERPTASVIASILRPYEVDILALRPFNPDYETVKHSVENVKQQLLAGQEEILFATNDVPLYQNYSDGTLASTALYQQQLQQSNRSASMKKNQPVRYEYLVQQQDGKPIQQIENQFFEGEYPRDVYQQEQPSYDSSGYYEASQQQPVYVEYIQPQYVQNQGGSGHFVQYVQPPSAHQQQQVVQYSYNVEDKPLMARSFVAGATNSSLQTPLSSSRITPSYVNVPANQPFLKDQPDRGSYMRSRGGSSIPQMRESQHDDYYPNNYQDNIAQRAEMQQQLVRDPNQSQRALRTAQERNNGSEMNDINKRINEALQRTQHGGNNNQQQNGATRY